MFINILCIWLKGILKIYTFKVFYIQKVCFRRLCGKELCNELEDVEENKASKVHFISVLLIAPDSKEWSNFPVAIHCFVTHTIHLQISGIWEQCNSSEHLLTFTFNTVITCSQHLLSYFLMKKKERGRKAVWKTHKDFDSTDKILHTNKPLNVSDIWCQYFKIWPSIFKI